MERRKTERPILPCPVPGCEKTVKVAGYCTSHYNYLREFDGTEESATALRRYGYDEAAQRRLERGIYCKAILDGVIQPMRSRRWRDLLIEHGLIKLG